MNEGPLLDLAAVLVLGISAQWLAWRFRLPSILLLLIFGFLAGPIFGLVHPDELLGDSLLPIVSLSVAVILFEGGLSLRLRDLSQIGKVVRNLVTVGVLVTWVLATLAASKILGLSFPIAVLLGAIFTVTGPTVIIPLLRLVSPRGPVGNVLKWEGILVDPVGAVLAVLVFEMVVSGSWSEGTSVAVGGVVATVLVGGLVGLAAAGVMVLALRHYLVPEWLQNPFTLMLVLASYAISNVIQHESGLLSVTVAGVALANQRWVVIGHIVEFKENLRVLLIGSLFILLAARLRMSDIELLGGSSVLFLVALIVVIRPLAVIASTVGQGLSWREKVLLSSVAPRGIVAAAAASAFALRLEEYGYEEAHLLIPYTFAGIVGTVLIYGLFAAPVARWLGLREGSRQGCLIVGAHAWARAIAEAIQKAGFKVLLVDSNRENVSAARLAGLSAWHGNILDEYAHDEIDLQGIGRLLALTPNTQVNALSALRFAEDFERREVYQLSSHGQEKQSRDTEAVPRHLRGRPLFGAELTYSAIGQRIGGGFVVKSTPLTEEFTYQSFRELYGEDAAPLFLVGPGKKLTVVTAEGETEPEKGQTLISLVQER